MIRKAEPIDAPKNLLSDASSGLMAGASTPVASTLQTDAQRLLVYAQTITNTGEELMFIMDVPYVPAQQTPIILAQATTPGAGTMLQPDFIFKACTEVEHVSTAFSGVNPALGLASYLERKGRSTIDLANIKITLLEGPAHGELISGKFAYTYDPEPEYIGNDKAVFMAEFEGKRYKIVVELHVFITVGENGDFTTCPPPNSSRSTASLCPVRQATTCRVNRVRLDFI